jgi:hypothetical protein
MTETQVVIAEPRKKPQVNAAKSLVYLSVSFVRKPSRNEATQYVKITNRLLANNAK